VYNELQHLLNQAH